MSNADERGKTITETKVRGVTATVKFGKDFDAPWLVFHGSPDEVREDIVKAFELDGSNEVGLSLSDIVANVSTLAKAKHTATASLGGKVISQKPASKPAAVKTDEAQQPTGDAAWAEAEKPAEPEVNPMLARIETVADTTELKVLWAENQDAFADPEVMAAWKAKGKALSKVAA